MTKQEQSALYAPQPTEVNVFETVNALTGQVNNLQRKYYRALTSDCDIKTEADRWYFRAIGWTCASLVFPPLFAVTALCIYKAKKCRKGGEE
ncbi:hypothetical protein [Bacteroides helcogenes]|uniref:Uncharacterized protein n=1 Tax=Bacteroides helcogenes (strain ATCC 35417 / DSM 20613 / JCM 6297 / CCUG 15421 / P 36-108) TaxID=693979 RepID=E6SUQ3_BACT6|nr:hypothetical protein [Bacteroides helcogenes]ADV44398.1 hypothetical protein Bache_2432 [Bacteroides helcogenes P 36-108]